MPVAPPPNLPVAVAPGSRPPETAGRKENCTAAWALVGVLLTFKAVTICLILVVSNAAEMAILPLLVMNWFWLIVLGVFLSAIPFTYWYRLVRARSRRKQLQRSEWLVR